MFGQDRATMYMLRVSKDSVFIRPDTEVFSLNSGRISKSVDLNADGMVDYIVAFGNCGNWGDCIFGFFVSSGSGLYACVFEEYLPPFSLANTTTLVKGIRWKNVTLFERSSELGSPAVTKKKLFFDGQMYRSN